MSTESIPPMGYKQATTHEIRPLADELEVEGAKEEELRLETAVKEMISAQQKRQELYNATSLSDLKRMLEGVEEKIIKLTAQPPETRNDETLELMETLQGELLKAIKTKAYPPDLN